MSLKFIEANNKGDFVCNDQIFDELFDEETRKLPLCVLCITGIFRGGKSFFLNLVMRYLRYVGRGGARVSNRSTVPQWIKAEGKYIDGYIKQERRSLRGFAKSQTVQKESKTSENGVGVKGGEKPVTTGIDFVKELFVIPDPQNPSRKICILLMDTQGLWDPNTDSKCNGSIFGLSCTLSSYLIFNHMGVLSSENLSQLATLTDFSSGLAKIQCQGKKAFQQLTILFRDCKDIDKRFTREEADEVMAEKWNALNTQPAYKKHTSKLRECFEGFDAMYICKPGDIDTPTYDGDLDEVNDLFFVLMGHFIEDIFMKIRPRIIGGEEVTGKTFIDYSVNFSNLFRNEDTYPDSSMIMDAACDVSNCKIIDNYCVEFESILKEYTKGEDPVDDQELKAKSDIEIKKMIAEFQTKANGSDKLKEKNTKDLDYKLNRSYKDTKIENDNKILKAEQVGKVLFDEALNTYCTSFSDYIHDDYCVANTVFDEAHKNALKDALQVYSEQRSLSTKTRMKLVKEINIKKNENIKKRNQYIKLFGQSIKITCENEMQNLEATVTSVIIESGACANVTFFSLNECQELKQLTIRDGNFKNISSFSIQNLPNLVSVTIGNDCFLVTSGFSVKCSFIISNCMNLKEVEIGCHSFKDYSSFSISKLAVLEKLIIGDMFNESSNFINCEFTLTDLPKLVEVQIGHSSFKYTSSVTFSNLRSLKEIQLGKESFCCTDSSSHSFVLRDLPSLNRLQSNGESLKNITNVNCSNVPNCDSIRLHHAFMRITSDSNYQCRSCSKDLSVMYIAVQMLSEIVVFLSNIDNEKFDCDDSRQMVETATQDLKKYSDDDVYYDRKEIIMDCKGTLDTIENAFVMDKNYHSSQLSNEKKKDGSVTAKRLGLLGVGLASMIAAPMFLATLPAMLVGGASLIGSTVAQDNIGEKHQSKINKYSSEFDRDVDMIKQIQEIRNKYKRYF